MESLSSLKAAAVGDWEACSEFFYSKEHLYEMMWQEMNLEEKRLCCAPFGGPIAAVRDERRMQVVTRSTARPVVRIFSAAGSERGSFLWTGGALSALGWSSQEELLLVEDNGHVSFYSQHGTQLPREFSFGPEVEAGGVHLCVAYGDGMAVLAGGAGAPQLWVVQGLAEPRPSRLPVLPVLRADEVTCLALIEPHFSLSSGLEVLVAVGSTLMLVDDGGVTEHQLSPPQPITSMAVSPDGHFLAVFTATGRLTVISTDFSKQLCEFETKSEVAPSQVAWCGTDAVVLTWPNLLVVVGPYGDWVRYALDECDVVVVPELDSCRLVSTTTHELLRRVPDCLVQVYRPGSTAPAAQLWDARQLFDERNVRADKMLRDLRPHLGDAVATCLQAAGLELSVPRQRALMRAAVFGRVFCSELSPGLVHEAASALRVLNALRDPAVGVPLTRPQLDALTVPVVIARLVSARHYLLALRIAQFVGEGQAAVLLHWAAARISAAAHVPDAQLKDAITAKLAACPNIRFAPLAAHAQAVGRRSLAVRLLEEETSAAQQVPLLLSLSVSAPGSGDVGGGGAGDDEDTLSRALKRAIESGDTDLVYLVLFHAYRNRPLPQFWAIVGTRTAARNLFYKFTKTREPELLETLWSTLNMSAELAELGLRRGAAAWLSAGMVAGLAPQRPDDMATTAFIACAQDSAAKWGQGKEHAWQSKASGELAVLLREQLKLQHDTGQTLFVGLSVADTVRTALRLGHHKAAAHIRKVFGLSEARWWWLRLRTLAERCDWEGLEALAAEKKSPIGWEPFLEVAKDAGAPREYLARLIARMPDSARKAEEFASVDCQREAAEVAAKLRDGDLFARIQNAVSAASPAGIAIAQIKERFQASFR